MNSTAVKRVLLAVGLGLSGLSSADVLNVTVTAAKKPLSDATVSLWQASFKAPVKITQLKTNANGVAKINFNPKSGFYYLKAQKGPIELLTALGSQPASRIVMSELTTVASVFTHAQLIKQGDISAPDVSLRIAANHVSNLADRSSGSWGRRLVDPINSTESETLSRINTLGNLTSLCALADKKSNCQAFLTLNGQAKTTLQAVEYIAKQPWLNAKKLFALHDKAYPTPQSNNPQARKEGVVYIPYLQWAPEDFSLAIRIAGGGIYAAGRIAFDEQGHLWSGQNWMPGGQNTAIRGIGGGLVELDTAGKPLSPAITGYTGMAVDGIGWGTAVINDKIWVTSFNSTIGVFDKQGKPVGPQNGVTLNGKVGEGQGVAVDLDGNVWVANATEDNLIKFSQGDITRGEVIAVKGLASPFSIAVDSNNIVYVSNALGETLTQFPASDPSQAKNTVVGISSRGLDVDSQGNVWVASLLDSGFPPPQFPDKKISIMKEFEVAYNDLLINQNRLPTGHLTLIRPDGKKIDFVGAHHEVNVPWGVNVDGDDNVWVGNFIGRSVLYFCGMVGKCPPGYQAGDLIHNFKSGIIQSITDATIDQAGNVWVANNWNALSVITERNPERSQSTQGGGSGITVIYGVAAPLKWPRVGPAQGLLNNTTPT